MVWEKRIGGKATDHSIGKLIGTRLVIMVLTLQARHFCSVVERNKLVDWNCSRLIVLEHYQESICSRRGFQRNQSFCFNYFVIIFLSNCLLLV